MIGFFIAVFSEYKSIIRGLSAAFKQFQKKVLVNYLKYFFHELKPFLRRCLYILDGYLIVMISYELVSTVISFVTDGGSLGPFSVPDHWNSGDGILNFLKYQTNFAGAIALLLTIVAGACLTLSAGHRWLVNITKLLLTLAAFYLLFCGVIAAI